MFPEVQHQWAMSLHSIVANLYHTHLLSNQYQKGHSLMFLTQLVQGNIIHYLQQTCHEQFLDFWLIYFWAVNCPMKNGLTYVTSGVSSISAGWILVSIRLFWMASMKAILIASTPTTSCWSIMIILPSLASLFMV